MSAIATSGLVASSTFAQLCAGWLAVLPIAALAIYGWSRGLFLALLAALQVLGSFLAAVTLADPVSEIVESLGCPASQSLVLGYGLVFAAVLVGSRLAVGAAVPEGACRCGPLSDQVGGAVCGLAAGIVLGGAILVAWSMANMPHWLRLDNTHQPLDSGGRALWTYARFVGEPRGWRILLDGDRPVADDSTVRIVRASEPFADIDGNGRRDAGPANGDGGEPYLDVDGDGRFTPEMTWSDASGDGRRTTGIRDCYRLADWRRTRVMHAPRIDSTGTADVIENTGIEAIVYQAHATDADGDVVTFAVEPNPTAPDESAGKSAQPEPHGTDPGVIIDATTGAVRLREPADFERKKSLAFVIVATDATGLSARQTVRLRIRDVLVEPAAAP